MKFAFSTAGCPAWDFEKTALRAREYGYDGVELLGSFDDNAPSAANAFLSDAGKIRQTFSDAGIEICCLGSSISYAQDRKRDEQSLANLRRFVDLAQQLDCGLVRILDMRIKPGRNRSLAGVGLGDWLWPIGDYAADHDVTIVVENALSFLGAREIWDVLDRLDHPCIAACWNVASATLIGETPAVSVPVLNHRIGYVHITDATFGPDRVSLARLGEGDVPVRSFLTRLRGIGYPGWVTLQWTKEILPSNMAPEALLTDSIAKLRDWTRPLEVSDWEAAAGVGAPAKAAKH